MWAQKYFLPQSAGYPNYAIGRPPLCISIQRISNSPCFKIVNA